MNRTVLSTMLVLGLLHVVLAEARAAAAERDELQVIRERHVAEILDEAPDDAEVARLLETIRADGRPALQAVAHAELGLALLAFYQAGAVQWAPRLQIAVEQPVLVLIRTEAGRIAQIAVADPARKHAAVRLSVSAPLDGAGEHWTAAWDAAKQRSEIRIELPAGEYAGQTRVIEPVRAE